MLKRCPQCKTEKEANTILWPKSSNRGDGLHWCCRECKRKRDNSTQQKESLRMRGARHYAKSANKVKARTAARDYWGSARKYKCCVLSCEETAKELHHLDYDLKLDVVPFCVKHHNMAHLK